MTEIRIECCGNGPGTVLTALAPAADGPTECWNLMVQVYCSVACLRMRILIERSFTCVRNVRTDGEVIVETRDAQYSIRLSHATQLGRARSRRGVAWFIQNPRVRFCRTAEQICMKFGAGEFTEICQHIPVFFLVSDDGKCSQERRRYTICILFATCCMFFWHCV
jgi:hypothetical protein